MFDRLLMAMTVLVATLAVASTAVAFQPPEAPPGGGSVSAAQAPQLSASRPRGGASPAALGTTLMGILKGGSTKAPKSDGKKPQTKHAKVAK